MPGETIPAGPSSRMRSASAVRAAMSAPAVAAAVRSQRRGRAKECCAEQHDPKRFEKPFGGMARAPDFGRDVLHASSDSDGDHTSRTEEWLLERSHPLETELNRPPPPLRGQFPTTKSRPSFCV